MAERKPRIVWEDHEHSWAWRVAFDNLRKRGYKVTVLNYFTPEGLDHEREQLLKEAEIFVIHSGTIDPPDMSEMIKDLKAKTGVKILLQTETVNELTRPLVEGIVSVYHMNDLPELERTLLGK